uniref:CS domain-containing protein n=1 Tax=Neobodo designis TaxID=312471 RepID=A0A7S1Q287_NEODS
MSTSNANVKWAQRTRVLLITVDIVDAQEVRVEFEASCVRVTGRGVVKSDSSPSSLNVVLSLDGSLADSGHSFKVLGQCIQIHATKSAPCFWEKLTAERPKLLKNWLSCDWALWKDEDDENDVEDKLNFGGGGYGDLGNMIATSTMSRSAAEPDTDDEGEVRPPADLSDLGV